MIRSSRSLILALLLAACGGASSAARPSAPSPTAAAVGDPAPCSSSEQAYSDVWSAATRTELRKSYSRTALAPIDAQLDLVLGATDELVAGWTAEHRQQCLADRLPAAATCAERRRNALGEVLRWLREDAVELGWAHSVESMARLQAWMNCDANSGPFRATADRMIVSYAENNATPRGQIRPPSPEELDDQATIELFMIASEQGERYASACGPVIDHITKDGDPNGNALAMTCIYRGARAGSRPFDEKAQTQDLQALFAELPPRAELRTMAELARARWLRSRREWDRAISQLDLILARTPGSLHERALHAEALYELVVAREKSPNGPSRDDRLEIIERVERLVGPMHVRTLEIVGRTASHYHEQRELQRAYDLMVRVNDGVALVRDDFDKRIDVIRGLADIIVDMGDMTLLDAMYQKELARVPDPRMSIRVRRQYGTILFVNQRYAELLPVATESLRLGLEFTPTAPWMSELHHDVGDAERGLGNLEAAAGHYTRALEVSPSRTPADWDAHLHRDLAMTLIGVAGQRKAALEHARRAREIFSQRKDRSSAAELTRWMANPAVRPPHAWRRR